MDGREGVCETYSSVGDIRLPTYLPRILLPYPFGREWSLSTYIYLPMSIYLPTIGAQDGIMQVSIHCHTDKDIAFMERLLHETELFPHRLDRFGHWYEHLG